MADLISEIKFSQINNEDAARNTVDIFLEIVYGQSSQKEFDKSKTSSFFDRLSENLKSKQANPKSKFYCIYMIKIIFQRSQNKVLSILASHNLLKNLYELAKQTDPNKPITEKGKSLFPDKQLGNDYIRLILETLTVLAQNSRGPNRQPTKFKKGYDQLVEMGIVMPRELKFYGEAKATRKGEKTSSANDFESTPKGREQTKEDKQNSKSDKKQKYSQNIEISLNKIKTFVEFLEDKELDAKSLGVQCQSFHQRFQKQSQKYQTILANLQYTGNNEANNILSINDFYLEEAELYKKYLSNQKNYQFYRVEVVVSANKLSEAIGISLLGGKTPQKSLKNGQKNDPSLRKNNHITDLNEQNKQLVSKLMTKLNQKSKSPNTGFKGIKESLSKQKSISRSKRSGLKRSNVTKLGKSMSKSRISQMFASPPNPNPKTKKYEGELVSPNKQLQNVMKQITKRQGHRRFITCNFKEKNPLFQNTHIQIGVKSEAIYENVNDFKVLIGIELYIGNKTEELIKNISISYKGNQDVLLYGNPRSVQTVLMGGYQHKHQLLVVPIEYHFPFIKMYLKYTFDNQTSYETITLPNSILKLASHGTIQKREFVDIWNDSIIYKTPEFKFTRYITPDSLNKFIKPLQEMTPYEKFIAKGSQTDLELVCRVILKQRYEGVLKLNIRPNFNAVIQLAVNQNSEQAVQSFIFYTQTLQMLLTHMDYQQS